MLSFKLTMPNVGSWNGQWTGAEKLYYSIRKPPLKQQRELDGKGFFYDFGDGWGASVRVEKIDSQEANRRRKLSCGFAGYDWMIDEILEYGRILTRSERIRKERENAGED